MKFGHSIIYSTCGNILSKTGEQSDLYTLVKT